MVAAMSVFTFDTEVSPPGLQREPRMTWVVMDARSGSTPVWVWGRVGAGPGFDEVAFTEADGFTPASPDEMPRIIGHLFTVRALTDVSEA